MQVGVWVAERSPQPHVTLPWRGYAPEVGPYLIPPSYGRGVLIMVGKADKGGKRVESGEKYIFSHDKFLLAGGARQIVFTHETRKMVSSSRTCLCVILERPVRVGPRSPDKTSLGLV